MWVIKSYNRPGQCARLVEQLVKTGMTTPGILFVNGGDNDVKRQYGEIPLPDGWARVFHDPNIGCNAPLNEMFRRSPNEPWYGCIDDDEWVETHGWDTRLIEAAGAWNIARADDGWQSDKRLHGFVTLGGDLVRAAGWWVLPGLWHYHGEEVWEVLSRELGLSVFCWDIQAEHRHWRNNKAQNDSTYQTQGARRYDDMLTFKRWMRHDMPELVKRIRELRRKSCR